jgi:DNA adenine methylase
MLPISPLRYPGSKRRLTAYIERALIANDFRPVLYVEPFVGGASVALHLLQKKLIEQAILMDKDPWVVSFWQTVFFDTEWLISQIETVEVTIDRWHELKSSNPEGRREQAWACFFLNRTSFSGILEKKAGPLGGREQKSANPIDCRFPRETLIARIQEIARHKERIRGVWCCSWDQGLNDIQIGQQSDQYPQDGLFFYFDPPFFDKADALYRFYFVAEDHRKLRDKLLCLEDKWVLSYDSAEQVETLYGAALSGAAIQNGNGNGTKKHAVELLYSVSVMQERKKGKEVILSNLETLPDFESVSR